MSNPSLMALSRGMPLLQELSLHNCAHITDTGVTQLLTAPTSHLSTTPISCIAQSDVNTYAHHSTYQSFVNNTHFLYCPV